jgi:anti-sigma regulatory factor (Ser/Thr protein kinase)
MARSKTDRGRDIQRFILRSVSDHPRDLVRVAAERFRITRQAAARYVNELIRDGKVEARGTTRQRAYSLRVLAERTIVLGVQKLEEDVVWRDHVASALADLPENVVDMWHYGCTEMVNNVIDHSGGQGLVIELKRNAVVTNVAILDDGVGIFRKITEACHLEDDRHAVLELAKGKLTTDPERHTGEGIFFTSRIMDDFQILAGDVFFSHKSGEEEDWILEVEKPARGTAVFMGLDNFSDRTMKQVFDHFASDSQDYGFTKTVVPVRLARQGAEKLISRSQAKRLLSRLDRFRTVILDFESVDTIGRAFADEIFRVFVQSHPGILVLPIRANEEIAGLIDAVRK